MEPFFDSLRDFPTVGDGDAVPAMPAGSVAGALPAGVVTFLLTDVEGSTRMWEGDEEAMRAAIARHYELLDAAVNLHGGVRPIEQGEGDSVVGARLGSLDEPHETVDAGDVRCPGGRPHRGHRRCHQAAWRAPGRTLICDYVLRPVPASC